MNFDTAPRQPRDPVSPGAKAPTTLLPCDRCVGRELNVCKPLGHDRLQVMLRMGGTRRWKKRQKLFRAGQPMRAFFKIRSGVVAVSRTLDDGRRQIIAIRLPGDCLGYLDTDGRYAFEGEALTDVDENGVWKRSVKAQSDGSFLSSRPPASPLIDSRLSTTLL